MYPGGELASHSSLATPFAKDAPATQPGKGSSSQVQLLAAHKRNLPSSNGRHNESRAWTSLHS